MHDTMSLPALIWAILWRAVIGAVIFYYGLERIDMLDRMIDHALTRRPKESNWHRYFFLDRPYVLREYLTPLIAWWLGGAIIVYKKGGKVSLIGAGVFLIAALPFAGYYALCALTIAMGAGLIGALLASLTSILGPLYLIEPILFGGFVVCLFGSLGE
jgi:hypothetical protein